MISAGGSLSAYRATLARLAPLIADAETLVPGHGRPLSRIEAQRLLEQDVRYLDALATGSASGPLPPGRRTASQRRIHTDNLARVRAAG